MNEFRILGSLEVLVDGRLRSLGAPKQRALLAALLLARGAAVPREQLAQAVWGDEPPESVAGALQVYVHGLRRALGAERIERRGSGYRVQLAKGELDLERFEELLIRAERALDAGDADDAASDVGAALSLWRGPALADLANEPVAEAEAARLDEMRLRAFELQNDARLALGGHSSLVADLERQIAAEPYRQHLREQYVLALYRSGRQKDALDAYRAARRTLVHELGVEPGTALRELQRRILQHDPSLAAPAPPAPAVVELPAPATPLIGRRLEVAAVVALFGTGNVRLVTLTGPGGTGKTRLGIAVAGELAAMLRTGAVFVDLAPVRDPELLVPTIAQRLGVREGGAPLTAALADHVRNRRLLLLLDNLEQLLESVTVISDLLTAAPRLLVLATSREPLRLDGEHRYLVPPLPAPSRRDARNLEALAANDAVRLFLARARAVRSGLTLTEGNASAVAEICRRLDGLPLAIELAAARSNLLPPHVIARELETSLELLTGGARDLPVRQQTLRATLDWSHALLSPAEQVLFERLGVFAGGCTTEAVDAICSDETSSATILASLVEKNLLHRDESEDGGARFAMLETIREYAAELLRATHEAEACSRRHAQFFLALAEQVDTTVRAGGADPAPLIDRLEREHDNLRTALERFHRDGDVESELRLASALQYFWVVRGHLTEGRAWLEHALAGEFVGKPLLRAKALSSAGRLAYRQGHFEHARRRYTESLTASREAADEWAIGQALSDLGGVTLAEGDYDAAENLFVQSAEVLRRAGHVVRLGTVLGNHATLCLARGEVGRAREFAEEALALQDSSEDKEGRIFTLLSLGRVELYERRDDEASSRLHASLALAHEVGYKDVSAHCLLAIGQLALRQGDPVRAARLGGAAEEIFESLGITRLQADDEAVRESLVSAVENALGRERAMAAWADGRAGPSQIMEDLLERS